MLSGLIDTGASELCKPMKNVIGFNLSWMKEGPKITSIFYAKPQDIAESL